MRKCILALAILLSASAAFAQQPQQLTPSQIALQINGILGGWAQTLEAQQKGIAQLSEDLAKAQARIKELESKQEEKK